MDIDNPDTPDLTEETLIEAVEAVAPAKNKGGWPKGKPRSAPRSLAAHEEPIRTAPRRRTVKGGQLQDKFSIPPEWVPAGMTYEWKNYSVLGKDNPSYNAFIRGQGFDPVPAGRHPSMMGAGTNPNDPIIRDGMILMERPVELTKEAMMEDYNNARSVIAAKEEQLRGTPDGQFQRHRADGSSTVQINRTYERGIPVE